MNHEHNVGADDGDFDHSQMHKCKIKISLFSENENEFEINMVAANIADLNSVQEDIISSVKSVKGLYGLIFRNEDFTKINY